jgi:hypothetical protein
MSGELFGIALLPLALPVAAVGVPVAFLLEASRNARLKAEREKIISKLEAERRLKEAEQHLLAEEEKTKAFLGKLEREREKEEITRKASQEEERRWELQKKLLQDKVGIKKIKKKRTSEDLLQRVKEAEKEAEVLAKLQSMELEISELNPAISELIKADLKDIKNSVNEIKGKISGNYAYFENTLKWLSMRLKESTKEGEDRLEAMKKETDVLQEKVMGLLIDIEMLINSPLLPDKGRALELKTALENAISGHDIKTLRIVIEQSTSEIKAAYQGYLEMEKLNDEREYIMKSVQDVLAEMGYEVSRLPSRTVENAQAPLYMELDIPGGEGVRLGFGMDNGIFAEVFHPKNRETNREKFEEQEKRWCSDVKKIGAKLKGKGIVFEQKWEKPFTDKEIEAIIVESEDTDKIRKEEEFRRRMIQEQRRMQR